MNNDKDDTLRETIIPKLNKCNEFINFKNKTLVTPILTKQKLFDDKIKRIKECAFCHKVLQYDSFFPVSKENSSK